MKTDARVRYTRRVIKEALLRLLEDRPVNRPHFTSELV